MTERATVTQGVYLAAETTPGDGTTPNRLLNSFTITPGVKVDMQRFRPTGQKLESIVIPGKEWTEAGITGLAEYSELHYLLAGVFGPNQVSQPSGAGTAQTWKFILSAREPDDVQTFSFVQGDDVIAHSFGYGLITELGFDMSRDGIKIDGQMIAHRIAVGASPPHAPQASIEVPVLPTDVSVYLSDTYGSLSGSKLDRALMLNQKIGNRHSPVWVLDAANGSFVAHVELAPTFTYELTVEANSDGMDLLANMRLGDTLFIRTDATSSVIAQTSGAVPYSYKCDAAVKIADVDPFSDEDGVYAIKYTLTAVYDTVNDLSVEVELVNTETGF